MLESWGKLLEAFPSSPSHNGVRGLAVVPFSWGETAVLEQVYAEGETIESAVSAARDFLHPDYAYVAAMHWDMWRQKSLEELDETNMEELVDKESADFEDQLPDDEANLEPNDAAASAEMNETLGWKRVPMEVTIACLGPEFEAAEDFGASQTSAQNPHFRIDFGLDTLFLPEESPDPDEEDWDEAALCYRDNISQLLGFMRRIEKSLPLKRRLLWSASDDDLAERIRQAYA